MREHGARGAQEEDPDRAAVAPSIVIVDRTDGERADARSRAVEITQPRHPRPELVVVVQLTGKPSRVLADLLPCDDVSRGVEKEDIDRPACRPSIVVPDGGNGDRRHTRTSTVEVPEPHGVVTELVRVDQVDPDRGEGGAAVLAHRKQGARLRPGLSDEGRNQNAALERDDKDRGQRTHHGAPISIDSWTNVNRRSNERDYPQIMIRTGEGRTKNNVLAPFYRSKISLRVWFKPPASRRTK